MRSENQNVKNENGKVKNKKRNLNRKAKRRSENQKVKNKNEITIWPPWASVLFTMRITSTLSYHLVKKFPCSILSAFKIAKCT